MKTNMHYLIKNGKRLVFGNAHIRLPFACIPKGLDITVTMEKGGLAKASWVTSRRAGGKSEEITHVRNIEHPSRKKFWLLA